MTVFGRASTHTATLVGTDAVPVTVEVDVGPGLPAFIIVGLGDAAVLEARDRIRAAVRTAGFKFPSARVVVNLAPAPLRKHGTGFDLPIATAILIATSQIEPGFGAGHLVGELSLDGSVRPTAGILAHALTAREATRWLAAAPDVCDTVDVVSDVEVFTVGSLSDFSRGALRRRHGGHPSRTVRCDRPDLADVAGHEIAKRALEIAAAGDHNVLMVGPPGSGKTMLAYRLGSLLPEPDERLRLEASVVHDVAGLDPRPIVAGIRPFRAPHHATTLVGLIGGGSPPHPGEISLAHGGVLFLDELTEFGPATLQALRQPLEDGTITLVRAEGRIRFPARFALIAAANPCPCGFLGDPARRCTCASHEINRFRGRIGGPLLDRFDMRLRIDRVDPERIIESKRRESSGIVRGRVLDARARARARGPSPSARLSGRDLLAACDPTSEARSLLAEQSRRLSLSGRGITRLLRVARTIADLDGRERVGSGALLEAIGYRGEESAV